MYTNVYFVRCAEKKEVVQKNTSSHEDQKTWHNNTELCAFTKSAITKNMPQMMCHCFSMTKRMSKLNCGGTLGCCARSPQRNEDHISHKKTQPWQGTLYQHITIQENRGHCSAWDFTFCVPCACGCWMSLLCVCVYLRWGFVQWTRL